MQHLPDKACVDGCQDDYYSGSDDFLSKSVNLEDGVTDHYIHEDNKVNNIYIFILFIIELLEMSFCY